MLLKHSAEKDALTAEYDTQNLVSLFPCVTPWWEIIPYKTALTSVHLYYWRCDLESELHVVSCVFLSKHISKVNLAPLAINLRC